MRALVVHPGPAFSVADVYDGWVTGLKACGLQVATFNLNDRLSFYGEARLKRNGRYRLAFAEEAAIRMAAAAIKGACYDWWPDLLLVVSAFFVPPDFYEVFRQRGHKVVILHTESPYEDDNQIDRAQYAHLNLINDPTNLERFQQAAPTLYMPHAYDPARHHPRSVDPEFVSEFCFVGTGYPSRIEFFESIDWSGINASFAGNWQALAEDSPLRPLVGHAIDECCPNDEAARRYTSSKMSANLYRRESQRPELSSGWAMTPREVELAACGIPFLRESRGEGDEVLSMLPTFDGPEQFGEELRWWLSHNEERALAGKEAMEAVRDRTFEDNARALLKALN